MAAATTPVLALEVDGQLRGWGSSSLAANEKMVQEQKVNMRNPVLIYTLLPHDSPTPKRRVLFPTQSTAAPLRALQAPQSAQTGGKKLRHAKKVVKSYLVPGAPAFWHRVFRIKPTLARAPSA
jgi:hypothetical protein